MGVKALCHGILLDIQRTVFNSPISETSLGFRKEARGDIRVHVVEQSFRKFWQYGRCRRSRARPDLDHSEAPAIRQPGYECLNRVSQHPVRRARHRCFQI